MGPLGVDAVSLPGVVCLTLEEWCDNWSERGLTDPFQTFGDKDIVKSMDELEDDETEGSEDDFRARKQAGWVCLGGSAFVSCFLVYDIMTGVVYGRSSETHRDTDPQWFWFMVCGYGLCALLMLAGFAASRIGDGWNDD